MRRVMVATGLSIALLAVGLVVVMPDLPDPVATHFGVDGTADRFTDRESLWASMLGLPAVSALLLAVLTGTVHRSLPRGLRWLHGVPVGLVWGLGALFSGVLLPQRGLVDAAAVTLPGWTVPAAIGVGVAVTLLASRLVPVVEPPTSRAPAPAGLPRADLADDATALWRGATSTSRLAIWITVAMVVGAVVGGILVAWWLGVLLLATSLLPLASARFDVTIGPASVQVSGRLGGWPRLEIPMDTVTAARVSTMRGFEYGGVGLRVAVGQPVTAVVTGGGPTIDLVRSDDSTVRINLTEADAAVAVVNSLLDRRIPEPSRATD